MVLVGGGTGWGKCCFVNPLYKTTLFFTNPHFPTTQNFKGGGMNKVLKQFDIGLIHFPGIWDYIEALLKSEDSQSRAQQGPAPSEGSYKVFS